MLIIFDLDDTLIDTSGYVTPHKLEVALGLLLEGCQKPTDLAELKALNEASPRTQDAIREFAGRRKIAKERVHLALSELTAPLPSDFRVPCTPHAKEILKYYASRCPLALITGGHPPFQLEKLEKAGIEASIFSMMAVPEDSVKKPFYKAFFEKFSKDPADVWVCGDRIPMDLAPAHELGFRTIHMRWGRGQKMGQEPWIDHSISNLGELRDIIT